MTPEGTSSPLKSKEFCRVPVVLKASVGAVW